MPSFSTHGHAYPPARNGHDEEEDDSFHGQPFQSTLFHHLASDFNHPHPSGSVQASLLSPFGRSQHREEEEEEEDEISSIIASGLPSSSS
jgi:hypothetical protein